MPSPNLRRVLVGDFAEDAAGNLRELSHIVAQIFRLLLDVLEELLFMKRGACTITSA